MKQKTAKILSRIVLVLFLLAWLLLDRSRQDPQSRGSLLSLWGLGWVFVNMLWLSPESREAHFIALLVPYGVLTLIAFSPGPANLRMLAAGMMGVMFLGSLLLSSSFFYLVTRILPFMGDYKILAETTGAYTLMGFALLIFWILSAVLSRKIAANGPQAATEN